MAENEWPGIIDTHVLGPEYLASADRFADTAKVGNWDEVFRILDSEGQLTPNQWRINGDSWCAPLHQVAWHGAPVEVVVQLIRRGAWRSLRNAAGDRPVDIARKHGHDHLLAALGVPEIRDTEQRKHAAWDRHLADLIADRTQRLKPVRFRPVASEVIAVEPLPSMWFGYPGMYGGFNMSIEVDGLIVSSWSRVVGGSGQRHAITERGCELVEEGFV